MIRSQRKELHEIPRPSVRPSVRGNRLPADANLELTEESHFHALHLFDNHTALGGDNVERVVVEREPLGVRVASFGQSECDVRSHGQS